MEEDVCRKAIDESFREVSINNLYDLETDYRDKLKEFELKLTKNQSSELRDDLNTYISLLISHVSKIREKDSINVFVEGVCHGVRVYRAAREKFSKST
ncbi:MAG: hypothetical protein IJ415_03920 [Clostridia bacterium]|nr:hypothetical protein [Clostridia bacterium]